MIKSLKLSTKLIGFTLLLLTTTLIVAGSSIWFLKGILSSNYKYANAAEQNNFMVAKEVDHLKWVATVQDLFVNNQKTLVVELDNTKCGLGKFLYGQTDYKPKRALKTSKRTKDMLPEQIIPLEDGAFEDF
jgi:hypothetical protein